jgi:hypothetical protein
MHCPADRCPHLMVPGKQRRLFLQLSAPLTELLPLYLSHNFCISPLVIGNSDVNIKKYIRYMRGSKLLIKKPYLLYP